MSCFHYPSSPPAPYPWPYTFWCAALEMNITVRAKNEPQYSCQDWVDAQTSLVNAAMAGC